MATDPDAAAMVREAMHLAVTGDHAPRPADPARPARLAVVAIALVSSGLLVGAAWRAHQAAARLAEIVARGDTAALPSASQALVGEAHATLLASVVAAAAVLVGAGWFWHRSVRRSLDALRAARQERLASLGAMTAMIAHEIRNPLAALKGHAQLLEESLPDAGAPRQRASRVVGLATRLERLLGELLDFVRESPIRRAPVDPTGLLRELASELGGDVDVADGATQPSPIDAPRVRMALTNLLRNARRVSPGQVVARAELQGDALVFLVRDKGPGVPESERERIFEPFISRDSRGVGLGLAIVRRVAELHDGTASVRNLDDGGAEFSLRLKVRA